MINIIVEGQPVPKQSYRAVKGGGYTDPRMKAWQTAVAWKATEVMQGRDPLSGPVSVRLVFTLSTHRRVDCDNLSKGTLDGLRKIVFGDDSQVVNLHVVKHVEKNPGVLIEIYPGEVLPPF
jgi:Holliday junction resolvase RusA-like endonuclease